MTTRPWLIGETNPYQRPGDDPDHRFDLYHEPPHSAGGRLCRFVLGLEPHVYRARFVRRNLLQGKWSVPLARTAAAALLAESAGAPIVLLGAKVAEAFGVEFVPFGWDARQVLGRMVDFAVLPHPSGLSRGWNAPNAVWRARAAVLAVAPSLGDVLSATPK